MTPRFWTFTDGRTLPIGTLYCIGRNYPLHAAEMGAEPAQAPIVFLKPPAAVVANNATVVLPSWSADVHHEVELVAVVGSDCPPGGGLHAIAGYAVGIDLTARDVQSKAKQRGEPWATAKAWHGSAPVSTVVPRSVCGDGPFSLALSVNGTERQRDSTASMERSVATLVDMIASIFTLRAGDAIFTGTPHGVSALQNGDVVMATLDSLAALTITCRVQQ